MRRLLAALALVLFALVLLALGPAAADGFVSTRGTQIVGPDGTPLQLRGINLGNWLVPEGYLFGFREATAPWQIRQVFKELVGTEADNAFWQRWRDDFVTRDDLRAIRAAGLNLIRVPFDYRLFTPEEEPGTWIDTGFRLLDRLVAWSAAEGLSVLLDMHAAPCGQTGHNIDDSYGFPHLFADPACRRRMAEVWQRIAAHYRNEPTVIGYDLLNEPLPEQEGNAPFRPALMPVYREAVAAIRAVDPNHLVVLSGINAAIDFGIFTDPGFDPKAVYTFHYYVKAPDDAAVAPFLRFRERYGVPILMGEAGENTDAWVGAFRDVLERHAIGWAFWTYKKMDAPSALRRYAVPPHWDGIVAYQGLAHLSLTDRRKRRPQDAEVRAALDGLLAAIRFPATVENPGFAAALRGGR
ncbi:glycoside hydrolase family 5 protein [Methylobacterium sp. JK268]